MADTISVDTRAFNQAISRLANPSMFLSGLVPPVNAALKEAERNIVNLLSGPVLKVRSGNARASVRIIPAQVDARGVTGSVGTNSPYLAFQHKGGRIVPRNAKNLAIPIGNALTPAGVPRYASPRQIPNLVFIPKTKAGNAILALSQPGGKLDPLFVLKKEVTIGPHDFLSQPKSQLTATLQKTLAATLAKQVIGNA